MWIPCCWWLNPSKAGATDAPATHGSSAGCLCGVDCPVWGESRQVPGHAVLPKAGAGWSSTSQVHPSPGVDRDPIEGVGVGHVSQLKSCVKDYYINPFPLQKGLSDVRQKIDDVQRWVAELRAGAAAGVLAIFDRDWDVEWRSRIYSINWNCCADRKPWCSVRRWEMRMEVIWFFVLIVFFDMFTQPCFSI